MAKPILDGRKKLKRHCIKQKNRSGQHPLNFPLCLNNKLTALGSEVAGSDYKLTEQVKKVYNETTEKINGQFNQRNKVITYKVPKFNELVKQKQVSAISVSDVM